MRVLVIAALLVGLTAGCDGECAHAPKVVPFHPGMTLCPGQSAVLPPIVLPVPQDDSEVTPRHDEVREL